MIAKRPLGILLPSTFVLAYGAVFAVWLLIKPLGGWGVLAVADLGTMLAATSAFGLAVIAAARSQERVRVAWVLVALGLACWTIAEGAWSTYELVLGREAPFPSLADVAYLSAYPLAGLGLVVLASPERSLARARTVLDAAAIVCAAAAIVWHLIVEPIYLDSTAGWLEKTVAGTYPLADLALLFALILALAVNRRGQAGRIILAFAGGMTLYMLADLAFAYLSLNDSYASGSVVDLGWTLGYLLMGYAAALHAQWRPEVGVGDDSPSSIPLWRQSLPLMLVAAMFVFVTFMAYGDRPDTVGLIVAGVAVGAVLLRYTVVIVDNTALNRALVHAEQVLETKVRDRTSELSRLVSILEATTDFVATFDPDGRFLYLNKASRAVAGINDDQDVTGKRLPDLFPPWATTIIQRQAVPAALQFGSWRGESAVLGTDGDEVAVSQVVLAHGSSDDSGRFLSTIARDISERKQLEAQLRHLANHDALTNLYNRRRFEEELDRELAKVRRFNQPAAVLFIDLDHFKYVNDTLGHHAGDQLLGHLGQVLLCELRDTDLVARLGGDEFGVLLSHCARHEAEAAARRLVNAIREHRISLDGEAAGITASIGVALAPEHGSTPAELLARSDAAMYWAKEERDGFCVYSPGRHGEAIAGSQLIWEGRIREALSQHRFTLLAQPIRPLQGEELRFELLLRMRDRDGVLLLPDDFLPVAEQTGLIHSIDRWVAAEAIAVAGACRREAKDVCLEVNLSAKAFSDADLLPLILDQMQRQKADPRDLVFEVTETAAVQNVVMARRFLEALRALGSEVALDDFGVGYSSLAHLKNLPVDYLKIDGSFVRNLPRDASDQHMVRSIVELARGLGKRTVAEWVGDQATLDVLREIGVDYAQGFFLGAPITLEEALGLPSEVLRLAA